MTIFRICRPGALVLVVAFTGILAGCSSSTSHAPASPTPTSVTVAVVPCPIPAIDYAGTPVSPQTPPPTLSLAASLKPIRGAQIYGTELSGSTSYLLGPTSATCQGAWASADGGVFMTAKPVSNQAQEVTEVIDAGGVGPQTDLACPYIPAILAADKAFRGNASLCTYPSQDVVQQIPTGTTNLYAAAVWVPAAVKDPSLPSSGNGVDATVALFTAQLVPGGSGNPIPSAKGQMVACTLQTAQQDICSASLVFFLATESDVGAHLTSQTDLKQMETALVAFLRDR